jgi:hypothetical protein
MALAFRGWSVLLLSPAAALRAAASAGEPLLAHWTRTLAPPAVQGDGHVSANGAGR